MKSASSRGPGLRNLFRPVDISGLVVFRIGYALVMLWEVFRYLSHGWVRRYWMEPEFNFPYWGFEWVQPWPGDGMIIHFWALGTLAVLIGLGLFYRVAAALFFLGFTYVFLLEEARYLNHFYLVCLISSLMPFLPAAKSFSLDARFGLTKREETVPFWTILIVRLQVGVAYFFGGVAKINHDWLRGEPMRDWLGNRTDFPLLGRFFESDWMIHFFSHSGLLIDLLAVPLLWWRRTRPFMFMTLMMFHLFNHRLFSIGIFPWFMLMASTVFFPASWPRDLLEDLRSGPRRISLWVGAGVVIGILATVYFQRGVELVPVTIGAFAGGTLLWGFARWPAERASEAPGILSRGQKTVAACFLVWLTLQVGVPLRHFFIPGKVSWTEEGHRFSWRMKLRDKNGKIRFLAADPSTGESWEIDLRGRLEPWQVRKMATRPYMIMQYAHHLARDFEAEGRPGIEIRAISRVSLNGRPSRLLIDPGVNLAAQRMTWKPSPWIVPFED